MQKPTHQFLSSSVKSGGTIGSGNHGGGSYGRGCGCQGGFSSLGFRPTGGSCLGGCGGRGCGRTTGGGVGKVGGAGSVGALGGLSRGGNGRTGNSTKHSAHPIKHAPHRICTGRGNSQATAPNIAHTQSNTRHTESELDAATPSLYPQHTALHTPQDPKSPSNPVHTERLHLSHKPLHTHTQPHTQTVQMQAALASDYPQATTLHPTTHARSTPLYYHNRSSPH